MIQAIKNIKDTVSEILTVSEESRDDDNLLLLKVWAHQNPSLRNICTSFRIFSKGLLAGKYANFESVRRVRQKLQEDNPKLRGKSYRKRHEAESEVRTGIHGV